VQRSVTFNKPNPPLPPTPPPPILRHKPSPPPCSLLQYGIVWLLLYAHRHRSILGAAGHITLTPAYLLMEEYSEPPEQSCLLRWKEKIASLCFGPRGDRTPYFLIRSQPLIDCATGPGIPSNALVLSQLRRPTRNRKERENEPTVTEAPWSGCTASSR
jgi:hypothetical protein